DETDPTRACNNGVDDDGDGLIDFIQDPGCSSPVDDDESNTPACQDGVDNDNDGRTDYPFDPGCTGPTDVDETDPPTELQCGNGVDDDGDGLIDYPSDPGCDSAADGDESNPAPGPCGLLVPVTDISSTGTTSGDFATASMDVNESPTCGGFGG